MTDAAVIVGASHAGVQAAMSLRQSGWSAPITLYSAEAVLPYHRPPLSKAFLAGEKSEEQIQLRAAQFYTQQGIELRLNEPVESIDPLTRQLRSRGGTQGFSKLILATGSRARPLAVPGGTLGGVYTLRDLADARQLTRALAAAEQVVVIGGGFIGLEFASTAIKAGKPTTVVEVQDRLLARALPAQVADYIGAVHRDMGVRFIHGVGVEALEGSDGQVRAVCLADGTRLAADLVLVGVGGVANLGLAQQLGLTLEAGGILVDGHGRSSVPGIYAIGDVAAFRNNFVATPVRLESVQNATDQAKAAAADIAGEHAPLTAVPWFWTDQYALKVQMAGLAVPHGTELLRGDPRSGAFTLLQFQHGRLTSAYSINRAADHLAARRLIAAGAVLDPVAAVDLDIPLAQTVLEPAETDA